MGNNESQKKKKKLSPTSIFLIVLGAIALLGAVVVFILYKTVLAPHASAKNASNRAFDAIYGCDFDDFVEVTIYNPDCMVNLGLSLSGELYGQIQPYFTEAKQIIEENGMSYRRIGTKIEEYEPGDEGFKHCVDLLRSEYFDVYEGRIEKAAMAVIRYKVTYRDENGDKQTEEDTDVSWCIRIDGKWYVAPNLMEDAE